MGDQLIRWVTRVQKIPATIQDKVALIVKDPTGAALTEQEQKTEEFLRDKIGLQVQRVPQKERFTTEYTNAKMVVTVHSPGFSLASFYQKLSDKKPTLFLYDSILLLKPETMGTNQGGDVGLDASTPSTRFKHYDRPGCQPYVIVQDATKPSYHHGTFFNNLAGWQKVGYQNCNYRTTIDTKTTPTAQSTTFGYNPAALTSEGKIMLEEIIREMTGNAAYPATIADGQVALIIQEYENPALLTENEAQIKKHLEELGFTVQVVLQGMRFKTDFRNSAFVVMTDSAGFTLYNYFGTLNDEMPRVVVLSKAFGVLKNKLDNPGRDSVILDRNDAFLKNFPKQAWQKVFDAPVTAFYYSDSNPSNWQQLGVASAYAPTVLFRKPSARKCGAAFGFPVKGLNMQGVKILDDLFKWMYHDCFLEGQTYYEECTPYTATCLQSTSQGTECRASQTVPLTNINTTKVEIVGYRFDDFGKVWFGKEPAPAFTDFNTIPSVNTIVDKAQCCGGSTQICANEPYECQGGCKLTNGAWDCQQTGGVTSGCQQPKSVSTINYLEHGANQLNVWAIDGSTRAAQDAKYQACSGQVEGTATVNVCRRVYAERPGTSATPTPTPLPQLPLAQALPFGEKCAVDGNLAIGPGGLITDAQGRALYAAANGKIAQIKTGDFTTAAESQIAGLYNPGRAFIDTQGAYIYAYDGGMTRFRKILLNTLTDTEQILTAPTDGSFWGNAIADPSGEYVYLSNHQNPGQGYAPKIAKVRLSDNTAVAVTNLPQDAAEPTALLIDKNGQYIYHGSTGVGQTNPPSKIFRVRLSDLSNDGQLSYDAKDSSGNSALATTAVMDPTSQYAYFGTRGFYVIKVRVSDFQIAATLNPGRPERGGSFVTSFMDPQGKYAYFGQEHGGITAVRLSDFTVVKNYPAIIQTGLTVSNMHYLAGDPRGQYLYFSSTYPGGITRVSCTGTLPPASSCTMYECERKTVVANRACGYSFDIQNPLQICGVMNCPAGSSPQYGPNTCALSFPLFCSGVAPCASTSTYTTADFNGCATGDKQISSTFYENCPAATPTPTPAPTASPSPTTLIKPPQCAPDGPCG